jgi:hypothetical protein
MYMISGTNSNMNTLAHTSQVVPVRDYGGHGTARWGLVSCAG